MAGHADALSLDLQDSVIDARKVEAREAVRQFLVSLSTPKMKVIIVRVNAIGTAQFEADVKAITDTMVDLINIPRVESADELRRTQSLTGEIPILVNIETPKGLREAFEIASAHPRVAGLQLGLADLIEPLGMDRYNAAIVQELQLRIRLAAAEAHVFAYDSAYPDIDDLDGLRREAEMARALGYLGKSAIHPCQVQTINEVFSPTPGEIAHALAVIEGARNAELAGTAVFKIGGKMVDAPFVTRAENTLALARRLGLA